MKPASPAAPSKELYAPAGAPNESSVLFSLATLTRAAPATTRPPPARPADAIVNLSGGAFTSSLGAPAPLPPPDAQDAGELRKAIVAFAAMALVAVAIVAVAYGTTRRRAAVPERRAPAPVVMPIASEPSASSFAPAPIAEMTTSSATSTPAPSRVTTRANERRPIASPIASSPPRTSPPAAKCCAGETEMVCQMRVSVGAPCGASSAR